MSFRTFIEQAAMGVVVMLVLLSIEAARAITSSLAGIGTCTPMEDEHE